MILLMLLKNKQMKILNSFDNNYKISFKGNIYYCEIRLYENNWSVLVNDKIQFLPGFYTPLHLELDTAFIIAKKKYIRLKKLERINENNRH